MGTMHICTNVNGRVRFAAIHQVDGEGYRYIVIKGDAKNRQSVPFSKKDKNRKLLKTEEEVKKWLDNWIETSELAGFRYEREK